MNEEFSVLYISTFHISVGYMHVCVRANGLWCDVRCGVVKVDISHTTHQDKMKPNRTSRELDKNSYCETSTVRKKSLWLFCPIHSIFIANFHIKILSVSLTLSPSASSTASQSHRFICMLNRWRNHIQMEIQLFLHPGIHILFILESILSLINLIFQNRVFVYLHTLIFACIINSNSLFPNPNRKKALYAYNALTIAFQFCVWKIYYSRFLNCGKHTVHIYIPYILSLWHDLSFYESHILS